MMYVVHVYIIFQLRESSQLKLIAHRQVFVTIFFAKYTSINCKYYNIHTKNNNNRILWRYFMHKEFDKAIGNILKELKDKNDYSLDELARALTIQCLKMLPVSERGNISFEDEPNTSSETVLSDECVRDYIYNKHKLPYEKINVHTKNGDIIKYLPDYVSHNVVNNYLSGKTSIPTFKFLAFCKLFDISYDSFINKVYDKLGMRVQTKDLSDMTLEETYEKFSHKIFGDRKDNRYVYNAKTQKHLLSSLFLDGKEEVNLHFTYLPMNPGLKDKEQKQVVFQRGVLTFTLKEGMCHVVSNVSVGSQGISSKYEGFAIVMNPKSNGTTCTCFLREVDNTFGVFVLFTFRLSPLDKYPRKTRLSECMAVRRSDGTAFVYRLLVSENFIDDDKMKYFAGHLKLCTSENTSDGKELNILIRKKYIDAAKEYFENSINDKNDGAFYKDLQTHFQNSDMQSLLKAIETLISSATTNDEIITISPDIFNKKDKTHLLLLGWLGKYSLSSRHDKIENLLDDEVENIHKNLYPELHDSIVDEWY